MFRLRTGNIPPDDLPLQEINLETKEQSRTLGRKKVEQNRDINLFPKKRGIEDKIAMTESHIKKGKTKHVNRVTKRTGTFKSYNFGLHFLGEDYSH